MIATITYPAEARAFWSGFRALRRPLRRALAVALAWLAYVAFYATTTFVVVGLPVALLLFLFG
jgi:hypothetical protein